MANTSSSWSTPPTRSRARLGKTLVAPIITYVPEGSWDTPAVTWASRAPSRFPKIASSNCSSVPAAASSPAASRRSCSSASRAAIAPACARPPTKLNELWKGEAKAFWVDDYYTKSHADQNAYITKKLGIPADQIGGHANILDTSEMLFVNAKHVRTNKLAPGGGYENSGVSGDPTKSTAALGKVFLQIKIDNALAQTKGLMAGTDSAGAAAEAPGGGRAAVAVAAGRPAAVTPRDRRPAGPPRPTFEPRPPARRRRRPTRSSSTSSRGKKRATRSRPARRR